MSLADLPPVPASVTVVFPKIQDMTVQADDYAVVVTLVSLALPGYVGVTGSNWTKIIHVTSPAGFTTPGVTPDNASEVTALANQIATDWYNWQLGREDLVLDGICDWEPDGYNDTILWKYHPDQVTTRIMRGPFTDFTDQLYYFSATEGEQPPDCGCPGGGGGPGGGVIIEPPYPVPDPPGVDPYPIPVGVGKLLYAPASNVTITGFTGAVAGQELVIWNAGPGIVKLKHNSGGANGIITPLAQDYWVQPRSGVTLEYGGPTLKWRFDNPTFGAGTGFPEYECRQLLQGTGILITPHGDGTASVSATLGATFPGANSGSANLTSNYTATLTFANVPGLSTGALVAGTYLIVCDIQGYQTLFSSTDVLLVQLAVGGVAVTNTTRMVAWAHNVTTGLWFGSCSLSQVITLGGGGGTITVQAQASEVAPNGSGVILGGVGYPQTSSLSYAQIN
jgi:hypothetical protein